MNKMIKEKYRSVLDLRKKFNIQNGVATIKGDKLHLSGTANTPWEKEQIWDAIKAVGGQSPPDIVVNINVANSSVYARHTVARNESLSKIAIRYYGDAMKYNTIFQANAEVLSNPDVIQPGQELVIPNL
jgi:nucleoid-associated protein YgaU